MLSESHAGTHWYTFRVCRNDRNLSVLLQLTVSWQSNCQLAYPYVDGFLGLQELSPD